MNGYDSHDHGLGNGCDGDGDDVVDEREMEAKYACA